MAFSSAWLKPLDFEVRLQQVQTDPRASVVLSWQNVKIIAVYLYEMSQFYVGVCDFG